MSCPRQNQNESGNALWFILLAVALLTALAMTITRSSDTVEQTSDIERLQIQASEIMRFTNSVEQAVKQLSMRNISENDLEFANSVLAGYDNPNCAATESSCKIFDVGGGGLRFNNISYVQNWEILGSHKIQDVETANNELLIQAQITESLCTEMNRMLGITMPLTDVENLHTTILFVDNFTSSAAGGDDNIIGDEAVELAGKKAGCYETSAGDFWFYHVLIAR